MAELIMQPGNRGSGIARALARERVWIAAAILLLALFLFDPAQGGASLAFAIRNILQTAPYLALSVLLAAYARASGADGLIASAFTGSPTLMVLLAALMGGLSPFCSCGVIPLIAALLSMGVPLSAVMAFWLASPVIDPSMFVLTAGVVDLQFAVAKTLAAIGIGIFGGMVTMALSGRGLLASPLREGVGNGGCGAASVRQRKRVVWRFWEEPARRASFAREGVGSALFLLKWLALAFILESLMIAHLPGDWVASALGGGDFAAILIATLVGVPAYLNGYAALPLVAGLIDQGMSQGAGLAFLVAGGVTSLPAAIAVWALARPPVFALYLGLALAGSLACGVLFQLWLML
ncbi:permease [Jiella endophytica]|uniref:Permease n=1 Tax=Jiella endophytica TaxID=2558362 RepID=A0A4Y8R9R4_9HYPH|nr:permease [Jiella endophytica]TFF18378.1 permease [Jiella endophytica]